MVCGANLDVLGEAEDSSPYGLASRSARCLMHWVGAIHESPVFVDRGRFVKRPYDVWCVIF